MLSYSPTAPKPATPGTLSQDMSKRPQATSGRGRPNPPMPDYPAGQ